MLFLAKHIRKSPFGVIRVFIQKILSKGFYSRASIQGFYIGDDACVNTYDHTRNHVRNYASDHDSTKKRQESDSLDTDIAVDTNIGPTS